ncbi:MAG: hypothetical protein LBH43_10945 [Treponema sp.]|jgi:hypothetical protein|nr:hypothetical protein [Treponema sp.]
MTKTLDDYLNDPDLANEPEALREIHAIRLKIRDERKGMTTAEYNSVVHKRAAAFLASLNDPG